MIKKIKTNNYDKLLNCILSMEKSQKPYFKVSKKMPYKVAAKKRLVVK